MQSFQDSIEQMLWPEKREQGPRAGRQGPGHHRPHDRDRATCACRPATCRTACSALLGAAARRLPPDARSARTGIEIGPIPDGHAGQPAREPGPGPERSERRSSSVKHRREAARSSLLKIKHDLEALPARTRATRRRARSFANLVEPLLELSKCPDFVVNRGHYFGTDLLQGGATRPERRRQARADRVPEDLLRPHGGRASAAPVRQVAPATLGAAVR